MRTLRADWLQSIFASQHRWLSGLAALGLAVLLGLVGGWVTATAGAIITAGLVVGLAAGLWMLRDIEAGLAAMLAIVCLLPFGAIPVPFSPKPTFLDLAVGVVFLVWIMQLATRRQSDFIATPLGLPVFMFLLLAVIAFVVGLGHAPLDKSVARRFVELLASIGLYFLIVNVVRDMARLQRLTRLFILLAAGAALIAIVLYFLPDQTSFSLLLKLQRIGYYPEGGAILRYIRDDPSLPQRATGTSVDPNALGGLLTITLGVTIPHLFAGRQEAAHERLFPGWITAGLVGVMGLALLLTFSRASFVGLAVALLALAVLRYRQILPLMAAALALILLMPWTQAYVSHMIEGLRLQDLSTQMRLGEYKDAFILIQRYPVLGVGFVASPDIDTYLKVACVYLAIAGRMGLVGLAAFLLIVGVQFSHAARTWSKLFHTPTAGVGRRQTTDDTPKFDGLRAGAIPVAETTARTSPRLETLWWGYHTGLLAALVNGVLDHYFFNLDFHHAVSLFWLILGLAAVSTRLISKE